MNILSTVKKTFPICLGAAIIPALISGSLFLLYHSGLGTLFPNALSLYSIFITGGASASFMIYLLFSTKLPSLSVSWRILTCAAYGLCAHAFVPCSQYGAQLVFAVLPLLMLGFEAFLYSRKTLLLILMLSFCLFADPITMTALMIGLLVLFLFLCPQRGEAYIASAVHLFAIYALGIIVSGAVSIPAFSNHFKTAISQDYSGFSLELPIGHFLSRLLPGSVPTSYYSDARNISLYFCLFFFFLFVIYFFHNGINRRERLKSLGSILIILFALEISPLRFIFQLFVEYYRTPVYFECLFIFLALRLAIHALPILSELKTSRLVIALLSGCLILLFGYIGAYNNFHSTAILTAGLFGLIYIICILCLHKKVTSDLVRLLPCTLIVLELICNAFLVTNTNIFSTKAVNETHYIWESALQKTSESENDLASTTVLHPLAQEYDAFQREHSDAVLTSTLSSLADSVNLTDDELALYYPYGLTNHFEYLNTACHKLGIDDNLFLPADMDLSFLPSDHYKITEQGGNVYNVYQYKSASVFPKSYIVYHFIPASAGTIVLYANVNNTFYVFDDCNADETYTAYLELPVNTNNTFNIQFLAYYINPEIYAKLPPLIATCRSAQAEEDFDISIYYWGIGFTCLGVFVLLLLYFNRDKDKYIIFLRNIREKIACASLWKHIFVHIRVNFVYYLAFTIPFIIYLVCMIVFSCMPFGSNSFFEQDGSALSIPSILGSYYDIKNGNTLFSMNGGYGYSPYALSTTFLVRGIFTLFPVSAVPSLVLLLLGIGYGLCAVSVVFYLTHRLSGHKAHHKDYRVLIPAFIYALNAYMLAFRCFPGWFFVYIAFPILLLAMDYLMHRKSWLFYTLTLAFCMFANLYLALYVCIFLVIWYFTYHFKNIRDFFIKGVRFAWTSVLAAGCNIFTILEIISTKTNSLYNESDSIFPSPSLHGSFWDQWKQLFIFSPSTTVTADNGFVNIYMSILMLILLGLYITSSKYSWKQKITKLIPIGILTISFNGQVLSYIWNGFHYQSKVPNRYIFLLMFLCAVIAYDVLLELKHTSIRRHVIVCGLLTVFVTLCYLLTRKSTLAFVVTIILIALYLIVHLLYRYLGSRKIPYTILLVSILVMELSANMFFTTSHYNLDDIKSLGNFSSISEFANSKLLSQDFNGRISIPGTYSVNVGQAYNVPTGNFFNSYVSSHQSSLHYTNGFLSGANMAYYNYNSTPFGTAISGHKYIFLPLIATNTLTDTTAYKYIGMCNSHYIYENPNVLSLGIYVPYEIAKLPKASSTPDFHNKLASLYTSGHSLLYALTPLVPSDNALTVPNSYSYLNADKTALTLGQGRNLLSEHINSAYTTIKDVLLRINATPHTIGPNYLYSIEFIPVENTGSDGRLLTDIVYPNASPIEPTMLVTLNEEVFEEFIHNASQNQMEDVVVDNNHIYGTTHYSNAGYTMLSLPYDAGWHAYIDGQEVELFAPYDSFMLMETPAGDHEIELIYERPNMKLGIGISLSFLAFTLILYGFTRRKKTNK
ncbi:MAG: YfhO family protein [Lachnospiraceae bacterium]|nr:YfhO family protein [Lachnospiraceae bacterium]